MAFLKLMTNIPITGTIRYANYKKNDKVGANGNPYPDQVMLKGGFGEDKAVDVDLYLPLWCEGELQRQGIIGPVGQKDQYGHGVYPILLKSPVIEVLKTEEGTKKFHKITLISSGGEAPTAASRPATAQPAARPGNAAPPVAGGVMNVSPKEQWARVLYTMERCFEDAAKRNFGAITVTDDGMLRTAHRLFDAAVNLGLLRTPPAAAAPPPKLASKDQLAKVVELCLALGHDDTWLSHECEVRGVASPEAMTEATCGTFITILEAMVAKMPTSTPVEDIPF